MKSEAHRKIVITFRIEGYSFLCVCATDEDGCDARYLSFLTLHASLPLSNDVVCLYNVSQVRNSIRVGQGIPRHLLKRKANED